LERKVIPTEPVVLDAGVTSARLLDGAGTPRYPNECTAGRHKRGGCEGRGEYALEVDARGRVVSVRTVVSAGCSYLDRSALLFFRYRARFEVVEKDGKPVGWSGTRKVDFSFMDKH
jgi:TonB family protein